MRKANPPVYFFEAELRHVKLGYVIDIPNLT